jgi:DNA-binding PucR family transcriptional regulator
MSNLDPVELGLAALLEVRRETLTEQVLVRLDEEMPGLLSDEDRRVAGDAARALIVDFTTTLRVGAERVDARPPAAALAFSRRMARRGASLAEILRAYRLGQEIVFAHLMDLARHIPDPQQRLGVAATLGTESFRYIDALAGDVARLYEEEREASLRGAAARRLALIDDLLAGIPTPLAQAEAVLGRRLQGPHRALVAWGPEGSPPDDAAAGAVLDAAAALAGDRPLLVATPDGELTAWFTPAARPDLEVARATVRDAGLRATLGETGVDLPGFVRTKQQAELARSVAQRAGALLTRYADVALASLLLRDAQAARAFATEQLGPLAAQSRAAEALRRTLAAYLDAGHDQSRAAALLGVHRNTVAAHLRQIEEQLGALVIDRAAELHAALLVHALQER